MIVAICPHLVVTIDTLTCCKLTFGLLWRSIGAIRWQCFARAISQNLSNLCENVLVGLTFP